MSFNEYIKYITETVIKHMELPKEERIQLRVERKNARRPILYHWFGLLPYSIMMLFKRKG